MIATTVHLEHALLDVADLARSLEFYGRLLPEWTIRWEGRNDMGGRWAHFGPAGPGQPGYLSLYEILGVGPSDQGDSTASAARIEHVGFAHPDVGALSARLEGLGIAPTDRMEDARFRRAYFSDPDGHTLEFVQQL